MQTITDYLVGGTSEQPKDLSKITFGDWMTLATLPMGEGGIFVCGDRYERADAVIVKLPAATYEVQLQGVDIDGARLFASMRAVRASDVGSDLDTGEVVGTVTTMGCGELFACNASDITRAIKKYPEVFTAGGFMDFHFERFGIERYERGRGIQLAYAMMGLQKDGPADVYELVNAKKQRVGFEVRFLSGQDS